MTHSVSCRHLIGDDIFSVSVPAESKILNVGYDEFSHLSVYFLESNDPSRLMSERTFLKVETGDPIAVDPEKLVYVGTVRKLFPIITALKQPIFHIFEIVS